MPETQAGKVDIDYLLTRLESADLARIEELMGRFLSSGATQQSPIGATPFTNKFLVRDLINHVRGSEPVVTTEQFSEWKPLLIKAACEMGAHYENNERFPQGDPIGDYYRVCWQEFQAAGDNEEELARAVDSLHASISWE